MRCGHCQHVFDATLHLQAALPLTDTAVQPSSTSATPSAVPSSPAVVAEVPAAALATNASPTASADPWEIPLPPPPSPATPEEVAATAPEVLDFAAAPELALELEMPTTASPVPAALAPDTPRAVPASAEASNSRTSVELDWPEAVPPAALAAPTPVLAPAVLPPEPAAPVAMAEPRPIPASSIPTDIDWPEPALEPEPDPAISSSLASTELAHGSSTDAPAGPVMPELDLAPDLAPVPPPPRGESVFAAAPLAPAPSLDDGRIEPSWSAAPPARQVISPTPPEELTPPATTASTPLAAAPLAAAAATVATAAATATSEVPPAPPRTERNPEEPSFVRAARRQALWRKPAVRIGLALLALVLLAALIGQILLHDRHRLAAAHPSWRPMLELLCTPLDCTVQPYRHIGSVVVESSTFNRVDGGVYHFAVTLKNRSDLALEMPAVELTLTDANEQPVLRRVFTPEELGAGHTLAAHAESSTTVLVRIAATGQPPMAGYRVLAFYP